MIRTLLAVLLACVCCGAQAECAASPGDFTGMADCFMKESLVLSPLSASQAGYHRYTNPGGKVIELDALMDDFSEQGFTRKREFYRRWQQTSHHVERAQLSPEEDADWQIIDDNISLALLELERVQGYRHNPTIYVEAIGDALFLPMTQDYASSEVRLGHVLRRTARIPHALAQAKASLVDADPIFISTALSENDGNLDLIEHALKEEIPAGSHLAREYADAAPKAVRALHDFSRWLKEDLARRTHPRSWRLGRQYYPDKFRYVLETPVTPEQTLADAEHDLADVRDEMLRLALPLHAQMYPEHTDHAELPAHERENAIIGEVLARISDQHPARDQLMETVKGDVASIIRFIRDKQIVALNDRDNLKVIATPPFLRGIYSVAGFHSAPPLEPGAQAQYWVTPIDPAMPAEEAESKLREYNDYTLKWLTIHEALPGHYIQAEHANNLQPEIRRVLRAQFSNGAYVEGWAEYVAQVMMDEGFLDNDPRFRLIMRKLRLRLLANTILDVRMHTMDMTDQQALELMTRDCFQTQAEAEGKLRRAKLDSVQLPTYYVGLREWFRLRQEYQSLMGDRFNLSEFHNRVLDEGALPVPLLARLVLPGKAVDR